MFIETTFMRYGKDPGGMIGTTLKPNVLKKWANSLHICTHILNDIADMIEKIPELKLMKKIEDLLGVF